MHDVGGHSQQQKQRKRREGRAARSLRALAERAARREERMRERAERRRRRAEEDRERRRLRREEDFQRNEQRRAGERALRSARRAEDQKIRELRKAEAARLARQHRIDRARRRKEQRIERVRHRRELAIQRAAERKRQANEAALIRAADAEARQILRKSRAEARLVHRRRKAEDAELRARRRAEDRERRRAVRTVDGVRVYRKRRWALWFGLGLVAVGVAMLGYVGWEIWGTNWVSHRKHERIVAQVLAEWKTAEAPELAEKPVKVPEGEVIALVRIPRFGDDYVVPILEGTSDEVLAAGFGHFKGTAMPGQEGNFALAAHRVTHGEPLREMPSLQVGDEIDVETRDATYIYVLTSGGDDLRVTFRDVWVVDPQLPSNPDRGGVEPDQLLGQKLITLTTCAELFHTDDRLVAFGILKSETDKGSNRVPG